MTSLFMLSLVDNELLLNIRAVFDRFRKFNLKLSPKKVISGQHN